MSRGRFYNGLLQIQAVRLQHTCRILFGIGIAQKEQIALLGDISLHNMQIGVRQRVEVRIVAVVDGGDTFGGNMERLADAVALKAGNGDDFPAFLQNAGYYQSAIMPAHFLIERGTAVLAGFQIDDVVKRQHQRHGTPQWCGVGGAVQQVRS